MIYSVTRTGKTCKTQNNKKIKHKLKDTNNNIDGYEHDNISII